ncbi:MAG: hypothetical protein Q7T61_19220 [Caulobacter sp.]|nr:hypothetical protein [Caulobacter sp.]
MSEAPRCSLDSRYEREAGGHDAPAHADAPAHPAAPVPYVSPHAVSVGVPGSPGQVFTTPISSVTGAGPNVFAGAVTTVPMTVPVTTPVMVQQPVIGLPMGGVTVINFPPAAGSPCPTCGKPLGDLAAHKPHEHGPEAKGPPAAPRFSKATPEVFRDGYKPLWDAAQADQAAYVVVSGCNKLLSVLLGELEVKARAEKSDRDDYPARRQGGFTFLGFRFGGEPEPKIPTLAKRIEKLQEKGYLLKSTLNAARESGMTEVLTEKIDASAVTGEMARRYVQLLWQVADQGFEQPGWSQSGEFPKAVAAPVDPHAPHAPAPKAAHAGGGHLPATESRH